MIEPRKTQGWVRWGEASWREGAEAEHRAKLAAEQRAFQERREAIARQPSRTVRKFLRRFAEFTRTGVVEEFK